MVTAEYDKDGSNTYPPPHRHLTVIAAAVAEVVGVGIEAAAKYHQHNNKDVMDRY